MAATAQDSGEQGCEIMGVPQGEGVGQQAETSRAEKEKPLNAHENFTNISWGDRPPAENSPADSVQICEGTDSGPGVENGAGLENGPVNSSQDTNANQQNLDESTSQLDDDAQQISADLSDVDQGSPSGQPQKKTGGPRKNPTPKKVPTPPKSATPSCAPTQQKKRGRKPKGSALPPNEDQLTSTPAPTSQNQHYAPEDQEMTTTPQKKKRGRKPKGSTLSPTEDQLTSTPAPTSQSQHYAPEDQEMTTTPQKKKRGRKPKGSTLSPTEDQLTGTPAPKSQNQHDAPVEQEMTPTPQKKKCGRKPKGLTLSPTEDQLTSTPAPKSQNQHDAPVEQEMTPTPQKKKCGRKPKGSTLSPTEDQLTSTPALTPKNQRQVPDEQEVTPSGRPKRRAATAAMQYLHSLVEELDGPLQGSEKKEGRPGPVSGSVQPRGQAQAKAKKGRKRKTPVRDSSDASGDEDFVPGSEGETEEEDTRDDDSVSSFETDLKRSRQETPRAKTLQHWTKSKCAGKAANGFLNHAMGTIWACAAVTKKFHEEHCASWVFPEWIPSAKDWRFLSESEAEVYLPKEKQSPAFKVSREGLKEDCKPCRIKRFESLPFHAKCWDVCFFTGGPVWSMEWCPVPDGSTSGQYAAIYCNRGMDDRHKMAGTYSEAALLQVWDMGELQYDTCPSSPPQLAYAIALDDGCIWDMKWCPSSAWELPTTCRKAPQMARLGLLAAAFSSGKIAVFSLPHRDALAAARKSRAKGGVSQSPLICQVQTVVVLKVGSIQAGDALHTGQCFCLDWLPVKPHNIVAAGFYDGSVALWNLNTKSLLQRVRAPDGSVTLYPYHSFISHDHIVRTIAWCRASSDFLATAGDDRKLKFWDLRKTFEPVSVHKRYLSTEISWPLIWSGICVGQQCCYATYGQHGIHYLDAGYLGYKPFFMAPRNGTIWSASFSDWLNSCVTADSIGELIMVLMPDLSTNPNTIKRTVERRFPVVRTEMVQFPGSEREESNGPEPQTYSEAVKKYYLHFHDMDMRSFRNTPQRAPIKHMQATEAKGLISLDKMPLNSLYKVRLNPNLSSQSWVLSGGQSGLVRAHCVRAMNCAIVAKMVRESEAQFAAMFSPQGAAPDPGAAATAVRHSTESTVRVL
ncbi:general transcription factor 3C polypeptide 2 [Anguilla anguilla]|uniref:general transcription factor 3C polypeptide 2 n=1 Tax=Anguilla anguilla TaxID=7936 RepID=UPI0015B34E22|nr:general transcription factor 3C polypeptide 2 [Anguilla anguilla]